MNNKSIETILEALLNSLEKKSKVFYKTEIEDIITDVEYEYLSNSNQRRGEDYQRINELILELSKISEIYSKEHSSRKKEIAKLYSIKKEDEYQYFREIGKSLNDNISLSRIEDIKKRTENEFQKITEIIKNHPLLNNLEKKKLHFKANNTKTLEPVDEIFFNITKNEFYKRHLIENYEFISKEIEKKRKIISSVNLRINDEKNINLISLEAIEKGIKKYNEMITNFDIEEDCKKLTTIVKYLDEIKITQKIPNVIKNQELYIKQSRIRDEIELRTKTKEKINKIEEDISEYNEYVKKLSYDTRNMHDWQFRIYDHINSVEKETLGVAKKKISLIETDCRKYIKEYVDISEKYKEYHIKLEKLKKDKKNLEDLCIEHKFNLQIKEIPSELENSDNLKLDNTLIKYQEINGIIENRLKTEEEIHHKKQEIKLMKKEVGEYHEIIFKKSKEYILKNKNSLLPLTFIASLEICAGISFINHLNNKEPYEPINSKIKTYILERNYNLKFEELGTIKIDNLVIDDIVDLQRILLTKNLELISDISEIYMQHQKYIEHIRSKGTDIPVDTSLFPKIIKQSSIESARGSIIDGPSCALRDLINFENKEFPSGHENFYELIPYLYFKGLCEGIDPAFAYGVNLHETGNNTSSLSDRKNNLFGMKDAGNDYPIEVKLVSATIKKRSRDPHQWYIDKISSINDFYNTISMEYVLRGQNSVITIGRGIGATYENRRIMPSAYAENNTPWIDNISSIRFRLSNMRDYQE